MKKILIEFGFDEKIVDAFEVQPYIVEVISALNLIMKNPILSIKTYKNKEQLSVDETSKQCLECPAYFTQESLE